jgi:hypothetical protein
MSGYSRDKDGSRRPVEIPRHAIGISHSDGAYSRGKITSRRTHLAKPPEPAEEPDEDEDEETP